MSRFDPDGSDAARGTRVADSPEAFDRLIQQVDPAALLVVIRTRMGTDLQRRVAPEDILQETLLCAWRDRDRCEWRGLGAFRAWILSILDNRIRDAAEHENAQKRGGGRSPLSLSPGSSMGHFGDDLPFASTTPSRIALYREKAATMQLALESLPDDVREVVRLRVFEQLSLEAIASRLGMGSSAALRRFRKGAELYHRRLRSVLTSRSSPKKAEDGRGDSAPRGT